MTPKNYFRLFVFTLIIVLGSWALIATKAAKNSRNDAQRYYENLIASGFEVQKLETKLGEAQYRVKGMIVERDEFLDLNDSLARRAKELGVKLKKAESIIKIETKYDIKIDTFYLDTIKPLKTFSYSDEYLSVKGFFNEADRYAIDSLLLALRDDIIVVPTVEGKWWQSRKKWKIAVRIHSKNPYSSIDRLEYYKFKKN